VTLHILEADRDELAIAKNIKCHLDTFHFMIKIIHQKHGVCSSPIYLKDILHCLGNLDVILVNFLVVPYASYTNLRKNNSTLLQDPANLPVKIKQRETQRPWSHWGYD
jgi:hypothetical protein